MQTSFQCHTPQDGDTYALRRVVQIGDVFFRHGGGSVQMVIVNGRWSSGSALRVSPAIPSSIDGQETTLTPPSSGSLEIGRMEWHGHRPAHTHTLSGRRLLLWHVGVDSVWNYLEHADSKPPTPWLMASRTLLTKGLFQSTVHCAIVYQSRCLLFLTESGQFLPIVRRPQSVEPEGLRPRSELHLVGT